MKAPNKPFRQIIFDCRKKTSTSPYDLQYSEITKSGEKQRVGNNTNSLCVKNTKMSPPNQLLDSGNPSETILRQLRELC